jgi:tRNA nucleotidyltransferase/poly(A) polymerase
MKFAEYITESEDQEVKKRWKEYISSDPMIKSGVDVLKKITSKGYGAWFVGGMVRDLIIGDAIHDVDIATDMPMDELDKIFKTHDVGKGRALGVVVVVHGGHQYEITQLRGENYMKPKIVRKIN